MKRILFFTAAVEAGTGLAFLIAPGFTVSLLLGTTLSGAGIPLGRVLGVALLSLGLSCWPDRQDRSHSAAARAMLTYNALIAAFLIYLATSGHFYGLLLWPAIVLHGATGILLLRADPRRI